MKKIRIAIAGVGNCASSLLQGIEYYRRKTPAEAIGLMHWEIGGYRPFDIEVSAAFDVDERKVGKDVSLAILEKPNCTKIFHEVPPCGVTVSMGPVLDGVSAHFGDYPPDVAFTVGSAREPSMAEVVDLLKKTRTDILLNYLPVGSERATAFYTECALAAGAAFVNNIPVFIASDPAWSERFAKAGLPVVGDDIKAQLGATVLHRTLTDLFGKRGVRLEKTYQLNTGGNTDFLNMLNRERLNSKKISKTEAVQSVAPERIPERDIHIGPSDWIPWLKDNKVCFIRMEGKLFGDVPMNLELRLSVEDSPNSAGVAIDAIRTCKLALERKIGGCLTSPSAYFCKHPPVQYADDEAYRLVGEFIDGKRER